jgi:hypothetical protein
MGAKERPIYGQTFISLITTTQAGSSNNNRCLRGLLIANFEKKFLIDNSENPPTIKSANKTRKCDEEKHETSSNQQRQSTNNAL